MTTLREIPDELWQLVEPKIPGRPSRPNGGRPPADDRMMLNGIFYVLRGGIAWREMPAQFGPWTTVYTRFWEWRNAQVFEDIWRVCLQYYDERHGIGGSGKAVMAPMCVRRWAALTTAQTLRIVPNRA